MRRLALAVTLLIGVVSACGENLTFPGDPEEYLAERPDQLACIPNLDGQIDWYEMAPTLNIAAAYRVSPQLPADSLEGRSVDVIGSADEHGRRVWDWSAVYTDDRVAELTAVPLEERWYAGHFPGGQFGLASDAGGLVEGIYSHDEEALRLHGLASREEHPPEGQTLLVYTDPIIFFPFPLTIGDSWTQTGEIRNGVLNGLSPWSQDDTYEVTVDAAGELRLPDFTFTQALRVYTRVEIRPKVGVRDAFVQHQYSFVYECFGEVARASSMLVTDPAEDPGRNFAIAREVRRLGWF